MLVENVQTYLRTRYYLLDGRYPNSLFSDAYVYQTGYEKHI